MRRDLSDLAGRFRTAIADDAARRAADDDADRRRLAEAREARDALLDELVGFLGAVGIGARREGDDVLGVHGDVELRFVPRGEGDRVEVTWSTMGPRTARLYREPVLGQRWVLSVVRGRHEDRVPLVDQGMTWLMVDVLGLPAPAAEADPTAVVALTPAAPKQAPSDATSPEPTGPVRRL
ncbi:MAG: hypothetical protein H6733_08380 [Alphaproteobacteria bacterium]|nr:hypothetical protein [Alphaproteobacteria bacterium]